MKLVNPEELVSSVAVVVETPKMTRKQRLYHLATIVRQHNGPLALEHRLETWPPESLASCRTNRQGVTAFTLAMLDKTFREQGLKPSYQSHGDVGSYADALGFLELTQSEMHEFSCDCGGFIDNNVMADRIETIADRA